MLVALLVAAVVAAPQPTAVPPVALVHHAVSTTVPAAQQRFDEGLTLIYGFNRTEARARFEDAARLDPRLASAWWGVALAVGPNINEDMTDDDISIAKEALTKARALEAGASPEERRYIAALTVRYPADAKADTGGPYRRYRDAMKALAADYPDDLDAATLYAESIMDVDAWGFKDGKPEPGQTQLVAILNGVLARDPRHIGANHYLIHAWDEAASAAPARASADYLADLTYEPADSHLAHMPGHTYLDLGDFAALERVGEASTRDDDAYAASAGISPFKLHYHGHNLDFWAGGALLLGDRAELDTVIAECPPDLSGFVALMLASEGRFDEAATRAKPAPPGRSQAFWYFANALAALARNDLATATADGRSLDALERDHFHLTTPSDDTADALLHARLAHARGDDAEAIKLLRATIAAHADGAPEVSEPWYFHTADWLGDILLARGDLAGAEATFRADLLRVPNNPRTLAGLERTLRAEKRFEDAAALEPSIVGHWRGDRSDLDRALL